MGNDSHLPNLCETPFWNVSASWQTTTPSLTPCFVDTLLSWVPVLFLWTNAPYLLYKYWKIRNPLWAAFPTRWPSIKGQFTACLSCTVAVQLASFAIATHVGYPSSVSLTLAKIITALLNLGTSLLLWGLFTLHSSYGHSSSGAIWFYLLLRAICGILSLPTYWQYRDQSHPLILTLTLGQHSIELVLLLLCSVAEKPTKENEDEGRTSLCPKERVSFPSRLTFSWFDSLVVRSYRTSITPDTLWDIRLPDKAAILFGQFNAYWKHPSFEVKVTENTEKDTSSTTKFIFAKGDFQLTKKRAPSGGKQQAPRLMGILVRQFAGYFFLPCLGRFIADCLALVSPLLMKCLITFASDPAAPTWHGLFYSGLLVVSSLVGSLTSAYQQHRMTVLGMRIRTSLTSAIYRKAFLLAPQCRRQYTTGELVNLVAVDCQRFVDLLPFLNFLWTAPVQIGLALWLLWTELGVAVLGGFLLLVACIPVNAIAMKQVERLQGKQMTLKDRRLKALSEMLSTMKLLKLYAWEEVVRAPIEQLRTEELLCIRRAGHLTTLTKVLSYTAPFMVTCLTFTLYVFLNGEKAKLTAEKAFVSVALFNLLRVPFAQIPNKWASLMVTLVAMKRLDGFLASKETIPYIERQPSVGVAIQLDDASFAWQPATLNAPSSSTLSSLQLTVPQGSLVAIVGSVGSGKSSLLSALLGQMVKVSGRVHLAGGEQSTIGYVPQQAWIQNGSVRENILFGKPYDETRYEKVLSACALEADLATLPAGDASEIGERGANLSGGQKQRLGIARACYSQADLYLFDDPLSAVDSHVGKHIFEQVLHSKTGLLRGRTRLLVTNALFVLPTVDQIVFLKEGLIEATGTYEQLCSSCPEFAQLCANSNKKQTPNGSSGLPANEPASPNEARQIKKLPTLARSPAAGNVEKVKGQLVEAEKSAKGEVSLAIYGKFLRPLGYGWSVGILLSYGLMILSGYGASFWLSHWTQAVDGAQVVSSSQTRHFLLLYCLIGSVQFLSGAAGWLSILYGTLRASSQLHSRLVGSLLQAPMSFFEATPLGRIVNRFSSDVDKLDTVIPVYLRILVNNAFTLLGTLVTVAITTPTFLLIILPVTLLYGALQRFYISTTRQLKRLESVSRSPVLTHLSESITGVAVIDAFTARERFIGESDRRVDESTRVQYPSAVATCWLQVRLDTLASLLIFGAAICAVLSRRHPGDTEGGLSGSDIGLSLSYILNVTQTLYWCVRSYTELESNLVAVERIVEYTSLPAEAPRTRDADDARLPLDWPPKGALTFEAYSTRYRPSLPSALSNITLAVQPNEKVSVVGRTGAGKSSLSLALFRLLEPTSGRILVDAVDITQLGLHRLRSSLAILPQEPLLLAGSLRRNLDPFQRHSDADLWEALSLSHLKSFIAFSGQGLEYAIHAGGENLSAGQRQLLCLARVLLQKPRLLVLDEATSSIDLETARLVEKTLRSQLLNCTVLSIAHRLDSVLDSDRVLVLAGGKVAELDTPTRLLSNLETIFYSMARDAGIV